MGSWSTAKRSGDDSWMSTGSIARTKVYVCLTAGRYLAPLTHDAGSIGTLSVDGWHVFVVEVETKTSLMLL